MSAVLLAKDKIEDSDATHALIFGEKDWIKAILDGTKGWELRTQRLIKIADGGPPVGLCYKEWIYGTVFGKTNKQQLVPCPCPCPCPCQCPCPNSSNLSFSVSPGEDGELCQDHPRRVRGKPPQTSR